MLFPTFNVQPAPQVVVELQSLLDNAYVKAQFGLDVYIVLAGSSSEVQMTSYWRGWFGFCRDGVTAKGIAKVGL